MTFQSPKNLIKKEGKTLKLEIVKLFKKGRLGQFPVSENRLRAGLLLMRDYRQSEFVQRITGTYNPIKTVCHSRASDLSDFRTDAADRYLKALKAVGCYRPYVLHFLRDDKSVGEFIAAYPVLNRGTRRTYKMVYAAVNTMLDRLVVFYDSLY